MALARATKGVFIVAAKRTPFGTYGGRLTSFSPTDLMEIAGRAALEQGNINPALIDNVYVGNVIHTRTDGPYLARHAAIRLGVPVGVPALMVNRLCGSGFQSVVSGAQDILMGDASVVLTGGAENMSSCPHSVSGLRFGVRLGQDPVLEDIMWKALIDQQINMPMGITAENLAEKYDISREDCDEFALSSQHKWKAAQEQGCFTSEMAPVTVKGKKGKELMDTDEHPKPKSTMEILAKLPPVFKKNGTVTAANASGISDGASCIILASEEACQKHDLKPLARLAGYGIAGCDPSIMGIGPVPAVQKMMEVTGVKQDNVDVVQVNEAFASQYIAVEKALGLDREKCNMWGGAIAMGHPVGASGNRITASLVYQMKANDAKYSIGSACIGGGQGIAVLLENV